MTEVQKKLLSLHQSVVDCAVRVASCTQGSMAQQRARYAKELAEKRFQDLLGNVGGNNG